MKKVLQAVILFSLVTVLFACSKKETPNNDHVIMMATTTSTDNSGLLDYLMPIFKHDTGITVRWIPQGTGAALATGKSKDADILMVHDKVRELQFMKDGYGIQRSDLMYNDFIIVGPKDSTIDTSSLENVLTEIYNQQLPFYSRGDNSGTNAEELRLWNQYNLTVDPKDDNDSSVETNWLNANKWYNSTGQGMGSTLQMANEKDGYTLTDRSTFIKQQGDLSNLKIIYQDQENETTLSNQYGIIIVTPDVNKNMNYTDAKILYDWLLSPHGQYVISQYSVQGQQLFFPDAPIDPTNTMTTTAE